MKKKSIKISYWFRKKNPTTFSIEHVFKDILIKASQKYSVEEMHVPRHGGSPISVIKNLFYAFVNRNESSLHHITGDIHYLALVLPRKKTVLTIHDCGDLENTKSRKLAFYIKLFLWFKWPIKFATVIVTVSERTKNRLIYHLGYNPDKIIVIPNIYDSRITFKYKAFDKTSPRILQVGTNYNKNLNRVIASLTDLNCTLVIIGKLSEEHLVLLSRYKIHYENYIEIPFKEVVNQYHSADLVIFASIHEGFGMPVIEAQAAGKPVVTSDIEPMNKIALNNSAVLVNPYSVNEIRAAVKDIIANDSLRDELVLNGLENAKMFTLKNVFHEYEKVYQKIINRCS